MPIDTLGEDAQATIKAAEEFLRSNQADKTLQQFHLKNLKAIEKQLSLDIDERASGYLAELNSSEKKSVDEMWANLNSDQRYLRLDTEQKANQQTFENLRRLNGGVFPKNISPVLYIIPLVLVGIAEWYVNYATFEAIFIPVFAIAGTLLVAAVFAWASHMHGAYLKQLAEIMHPSLEYRNTLGRKIAVLISTILLIAAMLTVIWLRYTVISDQLGISSNTAPGTFGEPSGTMVWSRLGPTIILNVLIWGLGTLYAWATNEKVPELRESYRALLIVNKKVEKARKPCEAEQRRIKAAYDRDREKNSMAMKEYRNTLNRIQTFVDRINQG
jgi:hypothetical protein